MCARTGLRRKHRGVISSSWAQSKYGKKPAGKGYGLILPDACVRHSGMVRKHQTRNLEIPGSMLRIAPE
jgi:hypothetical protein